MAVAKKMNVKPGNRKTQAATAIENPFDKGTREYAVAKLMLQRGPHSMTQLREAAGGTLSPRVVGILLRKLEEAGARFTKYRADEGMTYELDKTGQAPKIGNYSGADATGNYNVAKKATGTTKKTERVNTARKPSKPTVAAKAAPAKGVAKKSAIRKVGKPKPGTPVGNGNVVKPRRIGKPSSNGVSSGTRKKSVKQRQS